jgi:hypothetical protein
MTLWNDAAHPLSQSIEANRTAPDIRKRPEKSTLSQKISTHRARLLADCGVADERWRTPAVPT